MPEPVRVDARPLEFQKPNTPSAAIAVAASFTAEPVAETLEFWMRKLGLEYEPRFAPYNQVFQQLLDPVSLLGSNRGGINVVLLRVEDWARFGPERSVSELEADLAHLLELIDSASRTSPAPFLVAICPPSPPFVADPARAALETRVEDAARAHLTNGTAHLITPGDLDAAYNVEDPHDPHADELGHVPYTPAFFAALGTMLSRKIHALVTAPAKVIALDCDDTLWAGICGEDGPEGVVLDPPRRALQEFMLRQRHAGVLLAMVSKNNPEDVAETFRAHPEMPLEPEHFIAQKINWEPKPKNLAALSADLGLGLDSFVFIDDNPKESSEVEANCPEVLTLTLPAEPAEIPLFLEHVWALDHIRVTEEDRRRNELYAQRLERGRAEKAATSLEEFLATLGLEVRIAQPEPEQMARVAQLSQRTNQMNFTAVRRTESEVRDLLESGAAECLVVQVSDRFGSYGLTGVMIFRTRAEALAVDTFLLSCRALGRGVEHRMMATLGERAVEHGIPHVEARFRRTQRNQPALLFLRGVAGQFESAEQDDFVFRIPASQAAAIRYKTANGDLVPEKVPSPARGVTRRRVDYAAIADGLRTAAEVLEQIRLARPLRAAAARAVAPRTDLERRLATVWAETLGVASVGVHNNFFDLGGHSLLAVELLSRVRRELGVDLSLEVVYSGDFTVAELAKAIELKEIEQAGAEEYGAMLAELEKLSDEEVRQLLAQEGGEAP